mmetsp:Transcript_19416/g.41484  ORF Transcript_19416/g.41484 Transcript_19416/m.41484 type:complete len:234 (-) Transcript_19416:720-1421(-)
MRLQLRRQAHGERDYCKSRDGQINQRRDRRGEEGAVFQRRIELGRQVSRQRGAHHRDGDGDVLGGTGDRRAGGEGGREEDGKRQFATIHGKVVVGRVRGPGGPAEAEVRLERGLRAPGQLPRQAPLLLRRRRNQVDRPETKTHGRKTETRRRRPTALALGEAGISDPRVLPHGQPGDRVEARLGGERQRVQAGVLGEAGGEVRRQVGSRPLKNIHQKGKGGRCQSPWRSLQTR